MPLKHYFTTYALSPSFEYSVRMVSTWPLILSSICSAWDFGGSAFGASSFRSTSSSLVCFVAFGFFRPDLGGANFLLRTSLAFASSKGSPLASHYFLTAAKFASSFFFSFASIFSVICYSVSSGYSRPSAGSCSTEAWSSVLAFCCCWSGSSGYSGCFGYSGSAYSGSASSAYSSFYSSYFVYSSFILLFTCYEFTLFSALGYSSFDPSFDPYNSSSLF